MGIKVFFQLKPGEPKEVLDEDVDLNIEPNCRTYTEIISNRKRNCY